MSIDPDERLHARLLNTVSELERGAWDELYGSGCEGYDYFLACEQAPAAPFRYRAVAVFRGAQLVAGCPVFEVTVPLQTLIDGPLKTLVAGTGRLFPRLTHIRLLGLGSPHVDELPLAVDKRLTPAEQRQVVQAIDDALDDYVTARRADVILWKNLDSRQKGLFAPDLSSMGYAPIAGLPIATLAIAESEEAYIRSLSANMRSNIRRKLKKAKDIRVEIRQDTGGLDDQITALRDQTRARAPTDYDVFEELSPKYVNSVLEHMPDNSRLLLYWHDELLLGFALVLLEPQQVKEKYTGLRYPDALEHGVFFLNWITIIRLCQSMNIPLFRAGETTYLTKTRLGCNLHRSWLYVRHRRPFINWLLGRLSRHFDLDKGDPDLQNLGVKDSYRAS